MSGVRYTVLGAQGFIGARVAARLTAAGHAVFAPTRGDPRLFEADLGRVFYCAGLTGDYRQRPFDAVEAHVSLLARVLADAKFERLVYLSSTRLYDTLPDGPGEESRPLPLDPNDPHHLYELSKALGETLAVNQSGGRGAAARLSYVFDWEPGAAGFLSDWLVEARERRELTIESSPGAARDYVHVDDVARALQAILDQGATGILNVASGQRLSNAEIARVFEARGWRVAFTRADAPVAEAAPCDVSRLAAIGAAARDVRGLIDGYLAALPPS